MVAFQVIVRVEIADCATRRPRADEDHPIETLFPDRADGSFRVCVQIWGSGRQADHRRSTLCNQASELTAVLGVAVDDQVALAGERTIERVSRVPADLQPPGFVWLGSDASFRRWLDAFSPEDISDRTAPCFLPQIAKRTLDASVAPPRILPRHPCDEFRDDPHRPRAPGLAAAPEVELASDQLPVPAQQRIGRGEGFRFTHEVQLAALDPA